MRDYKTYYETMAANVQEKIDFIIDELNTNEYKRVVDFGCADGQTTRALAALFPNIEFIGIDKNKDVVKANTKNNILGNIEYVCSGGFNFPKDYDLYTDETLVMFSSVFHEIYSFMSKSRIKILLKVVGKAKAIAIRDMCFGEVEKKDFLAIQEVYRVADKKMLYDFAKTKDASIVTSEEGKELVMSNSKYITEFLLKSQYVRNWEEELKEDYFATDWDHIHDCLVSAGFFFTYHNLYMNEYLIGKLPLQYFTMTTHLKAIYRNKTKTFNAK